MSGKAYIPTATYRLQFNRTFTFRDAAALVPYLATLGVSHCYASPYLRARPGSMHGYDIIDHNSLNPEIGSPEDYEHFVNELHRHGMGQILDIVPNHMGVMGSDNAWWLDVLENGEASEYAEFFDIDWNPIKDELQGKVLIPILGEQYGNELEKGEFRLSFDAEHGEFSIFYHEHRFPVDPAEYPRILGYQLENLQEKLGATDDRLLELQSISTAFGHLPARRLATREQRAERNREKEVQKRRLAALCARSPEVTSFLTSNVKALNGTPENAASFDALHDLIKTQVYRLAQWRVAADDINYRRFFDINELAALCVENEDVFTSTHRFILDLVAQGKVNGLRIDHPDGLYDPTRYFQQLRDKLAEADAQNGQTYVVAEKILTGKEQLRQDWPIQGTTGYEFCNLVNGLFVDPTAAQKMERIYRTFARSAPEVDDLAYADLVYACKKLILSTVLTSELNVLANLVSQIALSDRHTCDFTLNSLRSALGEIIASFPVYRSYVSAARPQPSSEISSEVPSGVSSEDRRYVEQAVAAGRRRTEAADLSVFDFIRRVLLIEFDAAEGERRLRAVTRLAMKFQQVTAAVMAKGLEDTAFYRYYRLVSLNEVGGDPNRFGTTVDEFHRANEERLAKWPHSMLSSSTHDSKRSEDVRARINVLSEIPALWRLRLRQWRNSNRRKKRVIEGVPAPSRNDEYLLYQTLIGAWPIESISLDEESWRKFTERIEAYMLKAVREAKERTSWANRNPDYEAALSHFTRAVLERGSKNQFLRDFAEFQRRIAQAGWFNGFSQCLLKLAAPGVPDIYQGSELWQFTLVDPDNRRPVDYEHRKRLLETFMIEKQSGQELAGHVRNLVSNPEDGRAKLYLTWKTLGLRKTEAGLFQQGNYIPLNVSGSKSEHIVAFAREHEGKVAIVATPRLCSSLLGERFDTPCDPAVWCDTSIEITNSAGCYHNIFTGECHPVRTEGLKQSLPVADLFRYFPVAVVVSEVSTLVHGCAGN